MRMGQDARSGTWQKRGTAFASAVAVLMSESFRRMPCGVERMVGLAMWTYWGIPLRAACVFSAACVVEPSPRRGGSAVAAAVSFSAAPRFT